MNRIARPIQASSLLPRVGADLETSQNDVENPSRVQCTITIDHKLAARITEEAEHSGLSASDWIESALLDYIQTGR